MKEELEQKVAAACQELFDAEIKVELTRPEEQFGDYATNVALQLAGKVGKNPREIAEDLAVKLGQELAEQISEVSIGGPGFMNLKLTDKALAHTAKQQPAKSMAGQTVVAEYSDPNPFKVLHAGHLYTSLVGDAIARLMESAGAQVHRVNFGGDVGLHVGKTMWAIIREIGGENPAELTKVAENERLEWLSDRYVEGNTAYEKEESSKSEIIAANKKVYELHANKEKDTPFAQIYWTCRQWSYDGFKALYQKLDMVPFEKYYPESAVADLGVATVKAHLGDVYQQSDGAIIFNGEKYGLFTQVFVNSAGLPTYAGKDVGLIFHKQADFKPSRSFIITDHAQKDHLAVVMKSIEQFAPQLVEATTHYTHGQIKLAGGIKMSSRLGNVLKAEDILVNTRLAISNSFQELDTNTRDRTVLAAVKYAFTKNRIGSDIIYDPKESVSIEGNSGPYLQYAHARARSILAKAGEGGDLAPGAGFEPAERSLLRKVSEYTEVVNKAVAELMPHHICSYLYELAQTFNRFYEQNRVIGDERQALRLGLVSHYANTLKNGLALLGITAPDKM